MRLWGLINAWRLTQETLYRKLLKTLILSHKEKKVLIIMHATILRCQSADAGVSS